MISAKFDAHRDINSELAKMFSSGMNILQKVEQQKENEHQPEVEVEGAKTASEGTSLDSSFKDNLEDSFAENSPSRKKRKKRKKRRKKREGREADTEREVDSPLPQKMRPIPALPDMNIIIGGSTEDLFSDDDDDDKIRMSNASNTTFHILYSNDYESGVNPFESDNVESLPLKHEFDWNIGFSKRTVVNKKDGVCKKMIKKIKKAVLNIEDISL